MGERKKKDISDFEFVTKPKENIVMLPSKLDGEFGKFVVNDLYLPYVEENYPCINYLKKIDISPFSGQVGGMNLYGRVVLEKVLNQNGFRSMDFGDIDFLKERRDFCFNSGVYDMGVRFAGVGKLKYETSRKLEEQLLGLGFDVERVPIGKSRFEDEVTTAIKVPIWIPLSDLEISVNPKYRKGIGVILREGAEPKYMENLHYRNDRGSISRFSLEDGPIFENTKTPIMYEASETGTSRIMLRGSNQLIASTGEFSNAYPNSRIVIFKK